MEVIYKREQGHNYILFPGAEEAGIQTEMIRRNRIPGLAEFYTEWEDNRRYYGYDITGAKPLGQILEVRALTRKEAERFIEELAGVFQKLDAFLLDKDKLVLKPELLYVYTDGQGYIRSDTQGFLFFFCEEQEGSCEAHLRELVLYLFEKADEKDRQLTECLFRLYRLLSRGEPEIEELLACMELEALEEKRPEKFSNRVAEGRLEELYGSDKQAEALEAEQNRKRKMKKGLFSGKKGSLAKWLGREPMPMEEMWDDLEPERIPDKRKEPTSQLNRRFGALEETEGECMEEGTDHPTEILYMMEESGSIPCLTEEAGTGKIRLEHFPFYIGTQPGMDYCPESHGVSRIHLKLEKRGGDIWIKDLNSTNGTSLNGESLRPNEERKLKDKDRIRLAGQVYRFDSGNESW